MSTQHIKGLANKRMLTYIAVFLGLFFGYIAFRKSAWQSSMHFHTILEAIATLLATIVGIMALVRFYVKKNNLYLLVGTGFLGTAFLDCYHAVVTCEKFIQVFPSPPKALIPWSWFSSRIFLAIFMFFAWYFYRKEALLGESGKLDEKWVYVFSGTFALISFIFFVFVPLPRAYYPEFFFPRPQEFIVAFLFLLALIGFLRDAEWYENSFEHWLVLSLIVGFMGQAMFMSYSHKLYDFGFDAAHFLKKGSYICVLTGLIIAMYDLFVKEAENTKKLKESQEKLIQSTKMSAVGQLAGGVAHEINNPMGVILGFSQSIAKGINEEDPLYMPLKSIEREAIRCKKLIGDLLTFSRTGKTELELLDINNTIDETLSLIEAQSKVKNVEVVREYGTGLPQVRVNKSQIQQVIVNLCNNAIDAMPEGGKITISTAQIGSQVEIKVTDTGKGMTEEVKKHLFEPFFTTKEIGKGTGLGLSLCYEIINKHKGTIEVESEAGRGTKFRIRLPAN